MKVGLCTPCRDGTVHHQHMLSVIATLKLASHKGIKVDHFTAPGCSVLPRVRNRLVASALASKCDWIVFADDDVAWSAPDFFKLLSHGVDVVAAAPAKRHKRWDEAPDVAVKFPEGNITGLKTPAGRLWQVDGLATAFMAIRASVFEKLHDLTREYVCEAGQPMRDWFWFDLRVIDGRVMDEGEDYNFCRKWREVGGACWVDPDIRLRHYDGNVCHDRCLADMEAIEEEAA